MGCFQLFRRSRSPSRRSIWCFTLLPPAMGSLALGTATLGSAIGLAPTALEAPSWDASARTLQLVLGVAGAAFELMYLSKACA